MREIKFRGFDPKSGQMHVPMTLQQIKQVLIKSNAGEALNLGIIFSVTFDDLIFTQFTGLKDKHGKEIYEGDILNGFDFGARRLKGDASYMLGKVTFWAGMWALEPLVKYEPNADLYDVFHYCEIVGNEFENPELCQ